MPTGDSGYLGLIHVFHCCAEILGGELGILSEFDDDGVFMGDAGLESHVDRDCNPGIAGSDGRFLSPLRGEGIKEGTDPPGVALRFTPGYVRLPLRGKRTQQAPTKKVPKVRRRIIRSNSSEVCLM